MTADRAAIRARADATTPGPWELVENPPGYFRIEYGPVEVVPDGDTTYNYREAVLDSGLGPMLSDADWVFIAHAPTDITALLADLDAAEAERDQRGQRIRDAVGAQRRAEAERDAGLIRERGWQFLNDGWIAERDALRARCEAAEAHILNICDKHDALFRGDNQPTEDGAYAMLTAVLDGRAFLATDTESPKP